MKRVWIGTVVIITVVAVIAIFNNYTGQAAGEKTVRIGGAFALSGFGSGWGEVERNAAILAIEEANGNGGINGRKIELIVEDIASSNTKTVSAVSKLINVDKVGVILGPSWLDTFNSASPLSDENKVVMITPSASITAIKSEKNYSYIFSTWYSPDREAEALVKYIEKMGAKRVVFIFQDDPYWQDLTGYLKTQLKLSNLELREDFKIKPEETDFRTVLLKTKSLQPDAIVFGTTGEQSLLSFLQQRAVIYPESMLFTMTYIEEFAFKDNYKGLLENVNYPSPQQPDSNFSEKYEKRFGKKPVFSASNSYDAANMIIAAMKEGNMDAESIRTYLLTKTFTTITFGEARFDENGGLVGGNFVNKRVKNNTIEIVAENT
ncbi:MAG: ABC transporter substrate-binding protein [Candidatus Aenigmarchaeota archaeon]|nr:ABC transporter substrate-binding protein [Candidatus Aenigmarchaeota archaeon]